MTDVIVLGGGMIGITTALALQAAGRKVIVVDNGKPEHRSSAGNAGIIQAEAVEPYAMPRGVGALSAIATGRSNTVHWHWDALPGHFVPLWKYFRKSHPAQHRQVSRIYAQLTSRATRDHAPLIAAAGAEALIRRTGFLHAYRDAPALAEAFARAERLARDYGVSFEGLDDAALARAEPNLRSPLAGAIKWTDAWTCRDPAALVAAYARLFTMGGGVLVAGDAMTLCAQSGVWTVDVQGSSSPLAAPDVVICLGTQSAQLARRFGLKVPLFSKRGYHCHVPTAVGPESLVVDVRNSTVLAPMTAGLRILTGAEIARPGASATPRQLDRGLRAARELFDIGAPIEPSPWMGNRPCMPDMMPVVGAMPGPRGLWANFGHGHQGFTLGPTTAAVLTQEMVGAAPAFPALTPSRRF